MFQNEVVRRMFGAKRSVTGLRINDFRIDDHKMDRNVACMGEMKLNTVFNRRTCREGRK